VRNWSIWFAVFLACLHWVSETVDRASLLPLIEILILGEYLDDFGPGGLLLRNILLLFKDKLQVTNPSMEQVCFLHF
jgi:hypothetical protein